MSWNKGNNRNNMHGATIKIGVELLILILESFVFVLLVAVHEARIPVENSLPFLFALI